MIQTDIQKLVELRKFIISSYNKLDGLQGGGANVAVVKQTQVAHDYEDMIGQLDDLLRPHVKFE
jgi:hypothetical protein